MDLSSLLTHYRGKSFFLPAHGRGLALPNSFKKLLRSRAGIWDLPELPDIGSPLEESGGVADSQRESADLLGVDRCWYGVNGATGLLQAALFSMLRPGEAVLMPRNVHRSLINACLLGDFKPILFDLPFNANQGHAISLDNVWLRKVLEEINDNQIIISAAVLVHPTYHGYSCDISSLIKTLHNSDVPVLVDEAHGAHFSVDLKDVLPESAISAGADLVVHSLHKSSVGLCQTAVLWSQGTRVDPNAIRKSIGCFQTSSTSSLLLASCESAIREWRSPLGKSKLLRIINQAKNLFCSLKSCGLPLINNQDPLRLILHTAPFGISGFEADDFFISRGLLAELPEPGCLTFCLGFSYQKKYKNFFERNWTQLLKAYPNQQPFKPFTPPPIPLLIQPSINPSLAWRGKTTSVPLIKALDRVSAELICPYPPGIPMIIPGEVLDNSRLDWLVEQSHLWPEQIPNTLLVVT